MGEFGSSTRAKWLAGKNLCCLKFFFIRTGSDTRPGLNWPQSGWTILEGERAAKWLERQSATARPAVGKLTCSGGARESGEEFGVSEWVTIDQTMIDKFAEATGDHQWIHVDVARAKQEMPSGKTIAHGFLTLSLVPRLGANIWKIEHRSRGLNYGLNKLRFTAPVPAGSRVRLRQKLLAADDVKDGGIRATFENVIEIEGQTQPALIAEGLSISYP